jgi:hypothetical protein
MALNALYRKYFQKSKIFMYPLLDIKRGSLIIPTESYISWKNKYTSEDAKLICVYHNSSLPQYIEFENKVLIKHTRLYDYIQIDSTTSIFIFDFSDLKDDWYHFINGRYSKISKERKRKILSYFNDNSANYVYIESYLFPEKYRQDYADLLAVDIELLEKYGGELCDKPDMSKEELLIEVPNLDKLKILD